LASKGNGLTGSEDIDEPRSTDLEARAYPVAAEESEADATEPRRSRCRSERARNSCSLRPRTPWRARPQSITSRSTFSGRSRLAFACNPEGIETAGALARAASTQLCRGGAAPTPRKQHTALPREILWIIDGA
jgi:hypothetical protein